MNDEDALAEMLELLSEVSGISMGELLADVPEDYDPEQIAPGFISWTTDLMHAEPEGEDFDMKNDFSDDVDEYFDELMDDLDIDADDTEDVYSEA